jgi:hypothetical protein
MVVANPKQVKLMTESSRKDDRLDAQTLARLARIDPQLLRPIQHRSEKAQGALNGHPGARAGLLMEVARDPDGRDVALRIEPPES